jgi:hypothetical protein
LHYFLTSQNYIRRCYSSCIDSLYNYSMSSHYKSCHLDMNWKDCIHRYSHVDKHYLVEPAP